MTDPKDFSEEFEHGKLVPDDLVIQHFSREGAPLEAEKTESPDVPHSVGPEPGAQAQPEAPSGESERDKLIREILAEYGQEPDEAESAEPSASVSAGTSPTVPLFTVAPSLNRAAEGSAPESAPTAETPEQPQESGVPETRPETPETPAAPQKQPVPVTDVGPADFEVKFDFDRVYDDYKEPGEPHAIQRSRDRRTGCLGGIMYFVFILAVSVALACCAWLAATDVLALGKKDAAVEVEVPRDFTIDGVTDMLYNEGLIKYKTLFKLFCSVAHADTKITGGTYVLNHNYDYYALVSGMTRSGSAKVEVEVTIPEGYTLQQIFKLLEEKKICYADQLWDAAQNYDFEFDFLDRSTVGQQKRLEGFLFPDTYKFYMNDTPTRVIRKMLNNFENRFTEEYRLRAEELGFSVQDIVNVAAMIEREAGNDDERATIASVIYNRLNSDEFPHLQIDATIYYAIAGTDAEFSTEFNSPYNTYVQEGLPIGPIANPGLASIRAALYPEDTGYYYYALGKDGVHHFFKTYDPFNEFIHSDAYGG